MSRYCSDPWKKKSRKGQKSLNTMFNLAFGIAGAALSASSSSSSSSRRRSSSQVSQVRRQMAARERERVAMERQLNRIERQLEQKKRAAERERERILKAQEREKERLAKEKAKQDALEAKRLALELLDAEMDEITETNETWTCLNKEIDPLISQKEIDRARNKAHADFESAIKNIKYRDVRYGDNAPRIADFTFQATNEAKQIFGSRLSVAENELKEQLFRKDKAEILTKAVLKNEPKIEYIEISLQNEAEATVKTFWPWIKKKRIKAYVQDRLDTTFQHQKQEWLTEKEACENEFEVATSLVNEKKVLLDSVQSEHDAFVREKAASLLDIAAITYNHDKRIYESQEKMRLEKQLQFCLCNIQKMADGETNYITSTLDDLFQSYDLPMSFFVEYVYNEAERKVMIDLDLPEVEDIPLQKVGITPSGKRSIKAKTQKDIREDYANCICGLSQYIAGTVFNVSPKIECVEITGYTQRSDSKTTLITNQYVLVASFDRTTFAKIDFEELTAVQAMNFFKHHTGMSKTFVFKELDLDVALVKMENCEVVDYENYITNCHSDTIDNNNEQEE